MMRRFIVALLLCGSCFAISGGTCTTGVLSNYSWLTSCYYVSYTAGNDSNAGTTEASPLQHLPGMYGASGTPNTIESTCGGNSSCAGIGFILEGGVTWPNAALGVNWDIKGSTYSGVGCSGTGCVVVGVDPTWYSGGSWTRPIFNGGGTAVNTPPNGVANAFFRLYANYVVLDNIEMTGLYWTGSPAYGTGVYIPLGAGSPGVGTNDLIEHNYLHGWSHGTAGSGANDNPCGILGDTGIPNNNANSEALQNVIDGTDTGKDSCSAIFGGPPYVEQNFVQYVSSMQVTNGTVLVDSNTYLNGVSSFSGGHENCIEINASQNLTVSNNVCAHLGSGMLTFWSAPYPGYTITWYNNVAYDTDVNNIVDVAPAVYISGLCTQSLSQPTYCSNGGTTNLYNNTVECGQNSNPNAVCVAGIASAAAAVTIENNHFITNATTPNGGMWSTNGVTPTVTTNILQSLSTANGQGYNESQTYPFSPTSGGSTIGAGTNLTSSVGASFPGILTDSYAGVSYNTTNHTVSWPNRTANNRPSSGAWDASAYEFNSSQASQPSCSPTSGNVPQTVTCTNLNSGTTVMCYATGATTPVTNGLGTGCTTGTQYTTALTISVAETLNVVAGTSTLSDSSEVSYTYTSGGGNTLATINGETFHGAVVH